MKDGLRIMIRLDDIAPGMDMLKFNKMRELLDRYNVKPLIGVVPDCRDENLVYDRVAETEFWELVAELRKSGWSIAQHGTCHVYENEEAGILGINPFSEFAGLTYEAQYEKIKKGQEILLAHNVASDIFMAPGHTFDDETVKALVDLGFTTITDGLYDKPYIYKDILFVPCRLVALDKIIGVDTICYHTNLMDDKDFKELEDFLNKEKDNIVKFDREELKRIAIAWTPSVKKYERRTLKKRESRNKIANSKRLAWYLAYTNHANSKVKWVKRLLFLPLLLTPKYKKS